MIYRSLDRTADALGRDRKNYVRLIEPLMRDAHGLLADAMAPLRILKHPIQLARFGLRAAFSANRLARLLFRDAPARALLAGCAGHAVLPLSQPLTAALGTMFAMTAHMENWPVARGGSQAIGRALASYFQSLGGEIELGHRVERLDELPGAKVVLFDTSPSQLSSIGGGALPAGYRRRLGRYRYGPGAFKVDSALDGPIPWKDERCPRLRRSTSAAPSKRSALRSATCTPGESTTSPT